MGGGVLIYHDYLKEYTDYLRNTLSGIKPESLRIRFQFLSPPAGYGIQMFDGLLAKAVVNYATHGLGLPQSNEPYWIPLPLKMVATCPESGLPLWAANPLEPCNFDIKEPDYWHKRKPRSEYLKRNKKTGKPESIRGTTGQHKELQIPLPRHTCLEWETTCVGNKAEIERLIPTHLPNSGKKTRQGHGIIHEIHIEKIDSFEFAENRPLPIWHIRKGKEIPTGTFATMGWTPPYWHPLCQVMCKI